MLVVGPDEGLEPNSPHDDLEDPDEQPGLEVARRASQDAVERRS
jgi:hypothetical protein